MSESGPTLPMATGPMSEAGTLRHFTVTQPFGRFPGKADMHRQARPVEFVENDPSCQSLGRFRRRKWKPALKSL